MKLTLLEGNVFERIKEIHDESVDLVVTSPPFYNCRDYQTSDIILGGQKDCIHKWDGNRMLSPSHAQKEDLTDLNHGKCVICGAYKGEYGLEPSVEEYVDNTMRWINEVHRILVPQGSFVLDIGDKYANHNSGNLTLPTSERRMDPNRAEHNPVGINPHRDGIYESKSLMLVSNFLYCRIMQEKKFKLRNQLIWCRENVPSGARDRWKYTHSTNFWFVKASQPAYYFDAGPITKNTKDGKSTTVEGSWMIVNSGKKATGFEMEDGLAGEHIAIFPEELVENYIKVLSPVGGTVADVFSGSGTVGRVCLKNNRNFIGFELNHDYYELSKKRLNWNCGLDVEYSERLR